MASKKKTKKSPSQRVATARKKVGSAVNKSMKKGATGLEKARQGLIELKDKIAAQQPVEVLKHLGEQIQEKVDKVRGAVPKTKGRRTAVKKKVASGIKKIGKKIAKKAKKKK